MSYSEGQTAALASVGLEKLAGILRGGPTGPLNAIMRHLESGNYAEASRLARQPNAFEDQQAMGVFDLGHHIRHLGAGVEGASELMVHPKHGVNATKIYDPRGIARLRGIQLKGEAFNRIQNFEPRTDTDRYLQQRLVRYFGHTTPPTPTDGGIPRVQPAHHFEFVPGTNGSHTLSPEKETEFSKLWGDMNTFIPKATGGMVPHDTNKRDNWIIDENKEPKLVDFSLLRAPGAEWKDLQQSSLPGVNTRTIFQRHRDGFDAAELSDDPRFAEG